MDASKRSRELLLTSILKDLRLPATGHERTQQPATSSQPCASIEVNNYTEVPAGGGGDVYQQEEVEYLINADDLDEEEMFKYHTWDFVPPVIQTVRINQNTFFFTAEDLSYRYDDILHEVEESAVRMRRNPNFKHVYLDMNLFHARLTRNEGSLGDAVDFWAAFFAVLPSLVTASFVVNADVLHASGEERWYAKAVASPVVSQFRAEFATSWHSNYAEFVLEDEREAALMLAEGEDFDPEDRLEPGRPAPRIGFLQRITPAEYFTRKATVKPTRRNYVA